MSAEADTAPAPLPHHAAPRRLGVGAIVKEAFLTAIVALVLAIPLVGFRIVESGGTTA